VDGPTSAASHPDAPWRAVPAEATAVIRPELGRMVEDMIRALRGEVPEYDQSLEGGSDGRSGRASRWPCTCSSTCSGGTSTYVDLRRPTSTYIDRLADASVSGYAQEQSLREGSAQARRQALAELLLAGPVTDPVGLETAAELAGWPLPPSLAVMAIGGAEPGLVARRARSPARDRAAAPAWRARADRPVGAGPSLGAPGAHGVAAARRRPARG